MKVKELFMRYRPYITLIMITEALGFASSMVSREGLKNYSDVPKSTLTPPDWVFSVAWVILYALIAVAAARIYKSDKSKSRTCALWLFGIGIALNFLWSPIFFGLGLYGVAFVWLMILWSVSVATAISFLVIDKPAGFLMIPYILWLTFAAYLNLITFILNR
ncbi:MAG: TspO/MBR family protein [Ruminococcus sp.]